MGNCCGSANHYYISNYYFPVVITIDNNSVHMVSDRHQLIGLLKTKDMDIHTHISLSFNRISPFTVVPYSSQYNLLVWLLHYKYTDYDNDLIVLDWYPSDNIYIRKVMSLTSVIKLLKSLSVWHNHTMFKVSSYPGSKHRFSLCGDTDAILNRLVK